MVKKYDFDYNLKDFYDLNDKIDVKKTEDEIRNHEEDKIQNLYSDKLKFINDWNLFRMDNEDFYRN